MGNLNKQMQKVIGTLATFFVTANAQGMGNGISKFTRGQNEPIACLDFFNDILGGSTAGDSCPDNVCECATQGRSQLSTSGSSNGPHEGEFMKPPGPTKS